MTSQRNLNRILAYVRPGQSRTSEDFHRLCDLVTTAWNRIVDDVSTNKRPTELHGIFVMGSIIAGTEAGFALPEVSCLAFIRILDGIIAAVWRI